MSLLGRIRGILGRFFDRSDDVPQLETFSEPGVFVRGPSCRKAADAANADDGVIEFFSEPGIVIQAPDRSARDVISNAGKNPPNKQRP